MKTLIKASLLFVAISISGLSLFAQEGSDNENPDKKSDDIIIHKKGDSKEKTTIVIDGDKITINGKPVDEYKSDDLDIIRGENDMPFMAYNAPFPPHARFNGNLLGNDFMDEVRSNKAFLGVMTKKVDGGAEITAIPEKETAAEKAGLKVGDIITKVDDDNIEDADDLYKAIGKHNVGDKVTITYKRDGKETSTTATLGENKQVRVFAWKNGDTNNDFKFDFAPRVAPRIEGWGGGDHEWAWSTKPRLGIQVQDTEDGKGVKVLDVEDDEAAGKAGIKEDDIITAINGKNIASVDDLKSAVKDAKSGDTVKLDILRDGKSQTINVKFPKELKTTDL